MRSRSMWLPFVFVALLLVAASSPAQNTSPAPTTPDLLGIYVGMPVAAARAQLQKHASDPITNASQPSLGFSMIVPDPKNQDQITVWLTQSPNAPAVWMVSRSQLDYPSAPGAPLSASAVLTALHGKYGTETMSVDRGITSIYWWLYDSSGKQITTPNPSLEICDGGDYLSYISLGPPQTLNNFQKTCYGSYFALKATLNHGTDPQLLGSYTVQLVNLPYAYQAAMNTVAAKNAAAAKAKQDQLNQANQNAPKF
jgi:hypothetical protein